MRMLSLTKLIPSAEVECSAMRRTDYPLREEISVEKEPADDWAALAVTVGRPPATLEQDWEPDVIVTEADGLRSHMASRFDTRHWLERAREMRALAEGVSDEKTKETMLRIAKEYEKLAEQEDQKRT